MSATSQQHQQQHTHAHAHAHAYKHTCSKYVQTYILAEHTYRTNTRKQTHTHTHIQTHTHTHINRPVDTGVREAREAHAVCICRCVVWCCARGMRGWITASLVPSLVQHARRPIRVHLLGNELPVLGAVLLHGGRQQLLLLKVPSSPLSDALGRFGICRRPRVIYLHRFPRIPSARQSHLLASMVGIIQSTHEKGRWIRAKQGIGARKRGRGVGS